MPREPATEPMAEPRGELALRMLAMPADTNPQGHIFGGWLMSLMDVAAGLASSSIAKGRVATAAVSDLAFLQPVHVGDVVCCYTSLSRVGRTSIAIHVEAWVLRLNQPPRIKVTAAEFVMVAVDTNGKPRPVEK